MELTITHLPIPLSFVFWRILTSLSSEDNPKPTEKPSLEDDSVLSTKEILTWRAKHRRIEDASTFTSEGIHNNPRTTEASSNPSGASTPRSAPTTELGANPLDLAVSALPPIPSDADHYTEALKVELTIWPSLFFFFNSFSFSNRDNNVLPSLGNISRPSGTLRHTKSSIT